MNIIQKLPTETFIDIITYMSGLEIAKLRKVSKLMKTLIDENESDIYHSCMNREFPAMFIHYRDKFKYRTDWRHLYVITYGYELGKKAVIKTEKLVRTTETLLAFEKVAIMFELMIGVLTGLINIAKIASFGWSASRLLIRDCLKANPGMTIQQALKALGFIEKIPSPIEINYL